MVKIGNDQEMSRLMGKPTICIGENKDADQLRGNRKADQRLCFRYSDSTIPLLLKHLALFCACTGRLNWRVRNDWEPAQAESNFHHIHRTVTTSV